MMVPVDRSSYMDRDEVSRLRTVTEAWAITDLQAGRKTGVLVWAVVDTALQTGLRVSEIASLRYGDLDLCRGAIRVWRRKRRKPLRETLAISPQLVKHLRDFVEWKKLVGQPTGTEDALFVGRRGALTVFGLQKIWKSAVRRAGLRKELSVHCARHTVAVHLLRKTRNLRQVQKQLGHADPAITANMYADVSFEDMQAGMSGLYDDRQQSRGE